MFVCLFSLTEKERKRLQYKETVLKLAKEHKTARDIEKVDRYVIPDADQVSTPVITIHHNYSFQKCFLVVV